MKKQTQFIKGQNERKTIYNKKIQEIYRIGHLVKTNPIQSQTKPIQSQFEFYRRERRAHGAKGDLCKWLSNKEIQSESYFSAVLANSVVNEKQSQLPNFGDFVLSACLDKACRKQEIFSDKQRYKKGQDTLKSQSWLKKNTPKGSRTPVSRMRT